MIITMHNVDSSNLKAVGHDGDRTLQVQFHNGSTYAYTGVPVEIFNRIRTGEGYDKSSGKAFDALVKKAGYAFQRVS